MNIVINIASLLKNSCYQQHEFYNQYFDEIIKVERDHTFFIISSGTIGLTEKNVKEIAIAPKSSNVFLWKIWYAIKLPVILKKYKAAVFINVDCICSLKTNLPQCLLVQDYIEIDKLPFSKKNKIVFFNKASMVIAGAQSVQNNLLKQYDINPQKLAVIYAGVNKNYLPVTEEERDAIKNKYSDGKEYFLFNGELSADSNLINLLKAFSFFKKRQQSNMQLIIATKNITASNPFIKSLQTYKYKEAVKLIIDSAPNELINITASAYAFIYVQKQHSFYVTVLEAMQCGVPVIVSNSILMNEICGDAALYSDPAIFENIAHKMMQIFKEETNRNELIEKGKQQVMQYSAALTAKSLWHQIVNCTGATI